MTIIDELKYTLQKANASGNLRPNQRCVKFVEEMKNAGLMHPNDSFVVGTTEGNAEQLKLFAFTNLSKLKL